MAFKSYSWSIGTTSFRTSQLNYKIERQLQLLKNFWKENQNLEWTNATQEKYYHYLKDNNFLIGEANIPDKDAREKTSGLVDIGVLTQERRLTDVGLKIELLLNNPIAKNNIFLIPDDSYNYLLQFLKLQITNDGLKIKPFIALLYMIEKLDYLTYDEFTYFLPLCKNKYDVKKMIKLIEGNRAGVDIDTIITTKIYDMDNYLKVWDEFRKDYPVTEETFELIGMNRKSKKYDRAYNNVYHTLVDLVFHLRYEPLNKRIEKYNELYECVKKISGNSKSMWVNYLFFGYKPNTFNENFDNKFKELDLSLQKNIIDFKREFFTRLHLIKWKVNLKEYFDLNKRYFSLTDIIKFEDDKIELDLLPKYYFKNIIDDLLEEDLLEENEYSNLFHTSVELKDISPLYNIDMSTLVNSINVELETNLTIENINGYLEDEKIKQFNELIDSKYTTNKLIYLLTLIENRQDTEINNYVTDNATIPTIFEYILGISWYRISGKKGNILNYMNLSLDADLLPKTHAGGGMADIVYKYNESSYPQHNLLLEATLSESTGQRSMEMEPVSRHLGENIKITKNLNDYALFVANELDDRIVMDFRNRKTYWYPKGNGEYIQGLKIIPITIQILKKLLEKNKTYDEIYKWFDEAYNSTESDPNWYQKEIIEKV